MVCGHKHASAAARERGVASAESVYTPDAVNGEYSAISDDMAWNTPIVAKYAKHPVVHRTQEITVFK